MQIGPNPNGPQATIQTTYQINDNVSWTKGRHDFKFGFDGRSLIAASTFIQRVRGDYDYSNLERYLLDKVPDVLAQRNVGGKPYSGNNIALYGFANDNWKVNRNLTLNLGVRYEFTSVPKSMKEFALNSIADVPGRADLRRAAAAEEELRSAHRLCLLAGQQRQHVDPRRLRHGLRSDLRQRRHQRPSAAGHLHGGCAGDRRPPASWRAAAFCRRRKGAALTPAQARAATSSYLPAYPGGLLDQLEPRHPARLRQGLHGGRPLRGHPRRPPALPVADQPRRRRHPDALPADVPRRRRRRPRSTACR